MKLHFITSISRDYWNSVGKHCISTWNLPGSVTVFIDQDSGDLDWLSEVPFHKELLHVPAMAVDTVAEKTKVRKFWGKACAQIYSVKNFTDQRVIWLDADVEQIAPLKDSLFNFNFGEPFALLHSGDNNDCWETGIVIFNQQYEKLRLCMSRYHEAWNSEDTLSKLWKPYDAQVLGHIASQRGYFNLCDKRCANADAFENSRYNNYFKHWINKSNKKILEDFKK